LRLVSTAVSSRATLATRSITLRLSGHSAYNSTDSTGSTLNAPGHSTSTAAQGNSAQGEELQPQQQSKTGTGTGGFLSSSAFKFNIQQNRVASCKAVNHSQLHRTAHTCTYHAYLQAPWCDRRATNQAFASFLLVNSVPRIHTIIYVQADTTVSCPPAHSSPTHLMPSRVSCAT
jgi:hypothetical protein